MNISLFTLFFALLTCTSFALADSSSAKPSCSLSLTEKTAARQLAAWQIYRRSAAAGFALPRAASAGRSPASAPSEENPERLHVTAYGATSAVAAANHEAFLAKRPSLDALNADAQADAADLRAALAAHPPSFFIPQN